MQDKIIKYENLEYRIDMENILTPEKIVAPGMKVLLIAGNRIEAIKILFINHKECDNAIYINVVRLRDNKYFEISHVIEPLGGYVWWIVSFDYILNAIEDRVCDRLLNNGLLEFE